MTTRIAGGALPDGLVDRPLESLDPAGQVFHFVEVIQQGGFLRGLLEVDGLVPAGEVTLRPGFHAGRRAPPVPEQKLAEAVTGAQLVSLRRLPRPHQVAQHLVRGIRHPHRGQVSRAVTARKLPRIAPIGLDAIAGLHRHQRRRDAVAVDAEAGQRLVDPVAGGPLLIAGAQRLDRPERLEVLHGGSVRERPREAEGGGRANPKPW